MHRHTWFTTSNVLLTPYTLSQEADRLITWACQTCRQEVITTATMQATRPSSRRSSGRSSSSRNAGHGRHCPARGPGKPPPDGGTEETVRMATIEPRGGWTVSDSIPRYYTNAIHLQISPIDEVWLALQCRHGDSSLETIAQVICQPRLAWELCMHLNAALTAWRTTIQEEGARAVPLATPTTRVWEGEGHADPHRARIEFLQAQGMQRYRIALEVGISEGALQRALKRWGKERQRPPDISGDSA